MNLAEVINQAGIPGHGRLLRIEAGVYDVTKPIVVAKSDCEIAGTIVEKRRKTVLRRGRLPDGSLYTGPLLLAARGRKISLRDIIVDGGRFETVGRTDLPHYRGRISNGARPEVAADILLSECEDIVVENALLKNAISVGLGLGRGNCGVRISDVQIVRSGNIGLWLGTGIVGRPVLPLDAEMAGTLPREILVHGCYIEECGAAGAHVEAREVTFRESMFACNHIDFPYSESGGQIIIDYKSDDVSLKSCSIFGGAVEERVLPLADNAARTVVLGSVGIEASGSRITIEDSLIRDNSREGIHLNGARDTMIIGQKTRITHNHTARRFLERARNDPPQNVSITTNSAYASVNAVAKNLIMRDVYCENGVLVWTDGSVPGLRIDGLQVINSDLTGPAQSGVTIGRNSDGSSLEGVEWVMN